MKWQKSPPHPTPGQAQTRRLQRLLGTFVCLLIAGVFLANVVVTEVSTRYRLAFDLTANAAFEVGEETTTLLKNLEQDVEIFALATEDAYSGSSYFLQAQRMMERYPQLSPHVTLAYIDYVFDPSFAARYPDFTLEKGDILVTAGNRVKQIKFSDLFNYDYTETGNLIIKSSRAEEALTSAVLYVLSDVEARVAVLTGNGMADMTAFIDLLTANNYDVTVVNLTLDDLGDEYDLALLLGPRIDLSEDALAKLDAFLYNDGHYGKTLFYTADVTQEVLPNLEVFLKEWGIVIDQGAVFETTAERTYRYQPYYPVTTYVNEGYRDALRDPSAPVLMPLARPLDLVYTTRGGHQNEILLEFTETSGVRPPEAVEGFTVEQATRWGPMPALILSGNLIRGTTGVTQFRSNIIVAASTAMLDTFSIQNTSLSNSEYLLNLFNTLLDREDVVTIRPKSLAGETLAITTAQIRTLGIVLAGVLPLAILITGVAMWLARRYE